MDMLCKKCGKELNNNDKFCTHCGQTVQPDNTPNEQVEKKKKGRVKYWLIGIASFLAALGVLVAVFFADIVAWTERLILSPEMLMLKALATVAQDVGFDAAELERNTDVPNRYSVGLFLDESLQSLLSFTAEGEEDWISGLRLQITSGKEGNLLRTQIGLAAKQQPIASIDVIQNEKKVWLGVPELNSRYLELAQNEQLQVDRWQSNFPTDGEIAELLHTYGDIWVDSIHRVSKENTSLKISGIRQNVLQLTATIRPQDARQAFAEMAESLRADETARKLLNEQAGTDGDAHMALVEQLEKLSVSADFSLQLVTYLDNRNKLIGLEILTTGEQSLLYWAKTKSNGKFASLLTCGDLALSGNGTYSGNKETGICRLTIDGKTILSYELKAFSFDKDGISGSLIFPLPRDLLASSLPAALNTDLRLELCWQPLSEKRTLGLNLLIGDKAFVGLSFTGEKVNDFAVEIPESVLPAESTEAVDKWYQSLDWGLVVKKLGDAGVPIDTLRSLYE